MVAAMRIATWNINGMNARLGYVERWLEAVSPDLVGFQELKMVDERFPHEALSALGYRAVTHGQKSWNGVAVLAKEALEVTQVGLPGRDELGPDELGPDELGLEDLGPGDLDLADFGPDDVGLDHLWQDEPR